MRKIKKTIKVFEVGNYPQGEFSLEKVKQIFTGIKAPISGIFSHSSKWITEEKEPIEIGEFENFILKNNQVYADVEFNEKGSKYYNDGILKGVSVEIDTKSNTLQKIAVLPIGMTPAINGAEFQMDTDGIILEFEEDKLNLAELIESLGALTPAERITVAIATLKELDVTQVDVGPILTRAWELDDQQWYIKNLISNGYVVEKAEEFSKEKLIELVKPLGFDLVEFQVKVKTEEEIRNEIMLEFSRKERFNNLKTDLNKKVFPSVQPIIEFAIEKALQEEDKIIEFSETEKISAIAKFEKIINEMPESKIFQEHYREFTEEEKDKTKETEDRIGGYYGKSS